MTTATMEPQTATDAQHKARCGRCESFLRNGNTGDLCDPCRIVVASCLPYLPPSLPEQAPPTADLVRLVAGIMLTHDALHPGEPLYVREALAEYGVEADHLLIQNIAKKLRRRHGLVIAGESRRPGYSVVAWLRRVPRDVPHPSTTDENPSQMRLFDPGLRACYSLETAASGGH